MSRRERLAVFAGLIVAMALGLRASLLAPAFAAQADADRLPEPRIAVVAVNPIVDQMMDSDRFKPERDAYEAAQRAELLDPINEELQTLQRRMESVDRSNEEEVRRLREQFFTLQREGSRRQGELVRRMEQKVGEQLVECYALVRESAVAVAEQLGFNYVLASTEPDDKLETDTVVALTRDMLARPVLMSPKGADISFEVREDLKLR